MSELRTYWNEAVIRLLMRKGYRSFTSTVSGGSVLHLACRDMNLKKLKFIVNNCVGDPHIVDKGNTLLHAFCNSFSKTADTEILTYLCKKCECDPLLENFDGYTALECAIMNGGKKCLVIIRCLIEQHGCDKLFKCPNRCAQIISQAYKVYSDDVLNYLLTEMNFGMITDSKTGETILHMCCKAQEFTKLKYLIEKCYCDPRAIDSNGNTLLHAVCNSSPTASTASDILCYLCHEYNCDPQIANNCNVNALNTVRCAVLQQTCS